MRLLVLGLFYGVGAYAQYVDRTVLVGDVSATSITVTNGGPLGGTQTVNLPVGAGRKFKAWFSEAGLPERGSESPCANPCAITLITERGKYSYWFEITDSSGNPLSPRLLSSRLFLTFTQAPAITAPFTVPVPVHGFTGYTTAPWQFNISAGTDVSQLRIWVWGSNLRQGGASVVVNGNEHVIATTPITQFDSNGSVCTGVTSVPHGLTTSDTIQLNYFHDVISNVGNKALNGTFTVAGTPTTTSFTVACSLPAGDWNPSQPGLIFIRGQRNGKTVSKTNFYCNERKWYGGLDSFIRDAEICIPLGAAEMTGNANNQIAFKFNGTPQDAIGWWGLDAEVIQPDQPISQIVVTGLNAVATFPVGVPAAWNIGDTILIRDAPGPRWRFNGKRVITNIAGNTVTFLWGPDLAGETPGVVPYLTVNGTYKVPTSKDIVVAPQPVMVAARCLIPYSSYQYLDPSTYPSYGGNAGNGATLWASGTIKNHFDYFPGHASLAHCANCHTKTGFDLKYFAWPPYVIKVECRARDLTESQANDIVAFIAANSTPVPAKGRPWNPPYQPGCAIDSSAVSNWAAGCGLEWILTYDQDIREFAVPGGTPPSWAGGSYAQWAPSAGGINPRTTPISLSLPAWWQWLPVINPLDSYHYMFGGSFSDFTTDPMWTRYNAYQATQVSHDLTTYAANSYFQLVKDSPSPGDPGDLFTPLVSGNPSGTGFLFVNGLKAAPGGSIQLSAGAVYPSPYLPAQYSVNQWVTSRIFEMMNVFNLQDLCDQVYTGINGSPNARSAAMYQRCWYSEYPFNQGPHKAIGGQHAGFKHIGNLDEGIFNTETTSWYQLAGVVDPGNRFMQGNFEWDVPYYYAFNSATAYYRPSMYMHLYPMMLELANSNGWADLNNNGNANVQPQVSSNPRFTVVSRWVDPFTPDAEEAELINQAAQQLLYAVNTYSTASWRNHITNEEGPTGLTATPKAVQAFNSGGIRSDGIALALAYFKFYGVNSTDINTLVTKWNAVYQSSNGHDFAVDAAATCSLSGGHPNVLLCSNF